jgi:hypothetical protein
MADGWEVHNVESFDSSTNSLGNNNSNEEESKFKEYYEEEVVQPDDHYYFDEMNYGYKEETEGYGDYWDKNPEGDSYEVASDDNDPEDNNRNIYTDEVPMALCMVGAMMKHVVRKPLVVLFDSGSSHTWWNIKSIPGGVVPRKVDSSSSSTLAGPMQSNLEVTVEDVTFPEFFKTRQIGKVEAWVFTAECRYDAIIGRDLVRELWMNLDFKNNKMTLDDCHVPMKVFNWELKNPYGIKEPNVAEQLFLDLLEADLEDDDTYPTCDTTHLSDNDYSLNDEFFSDHGDDQIMDDDVYAPDSKDINVSKYETTDIDKVVRTCTHLDQTQQNDLCTVLKHYPKLFDNEGPVR